MGGSGEELRSRESIIDEPQKAYGQPRDLYTRTIGLL